MLERFQEDPKLLGGAGRVVAFEIHVHMIRAHEVFRRQVLEKLVDLVAIGGDGPLEERGVVDDPHDQRPALELGDAIGQVLLGGVGVASATSLETSAESIGSYSGGTIVIWAEAW